MGPTRGIWPQRAYPANVPTVGVDANQKTAARLVGAQKAEWRRIARDRRESAQIETQLMGTQRPRIVRIMDDRQRDYNLRCADRWGGGQTFREKFRWPSEEGKGRADEGSSRGKAVTCDRKRKDVASTAGPAGKGPERDTPRNMREVVEPSTA